MKFKKTGAEKSTITREVNELTEKTGNYEWYIGSKGDKMRDTLLTFVTESALQNLVRFNTEALGLKSIYKSNLVQ